MAHTILERLKNRHRNRVEKEVTILHPLQPEREHRVPQPREFHAIVKLASDQVGGAVTMIHAELHKELIRELMRFLPIAGSNQARLNLREKGEGEMVGLHNFC